MWEESIAEIMILVVEGDRSLVSEEYANVRVFTRGLHTPKGRSGSHLLLIKSAAPRLDLAFRVAGVELLMNETQNG